MSARDEVCRRIEEVGIVPVFRLPSAELARAPSEAVFAGGIPVFEITLTVPDARRLDPLARRSLTAGALWSAPAPCSTPKQRVRASTRAHEFIVSPGTDRRRSSAAARATSP